MIKHNNNDFDTSNTLTHLKKEKTSSVYIILSR